MTTDMVNIQEQLAQELAELDKTVAPPSGVRISLKGKQFAFPDGKVSPGPINAVILDWRSVNQYYKGAYNPQKIEPPSCYAMAKDRTGMAPMETAPDPQATACEGCPWNEWGSASGGGRGKACKNQVKIALVPPDATATTPPWIIDVAPSATSGFTNFVNNCKGQFGKLPIQMQVSLDFDPNQDYPKLTFADPEPLPDALVPMMFGLRTIAQPLLDKDPGAQ